MKNWNGISDKHEWQILQAVVACIVLFHLFGFFFRRDFQTLKLKSSEVLSP